MSSNIKEIRFSPDSQEGTKSVLGRWLKNIGDQVTEHEPLVEISTDKVSMELSAPASGVLKEIFIEADTELSANDLLGSIALGEVAVEKTSASTNKTSHESQKQTGEAERLSPAVKQLLKQNNLEAKDIVGTGRDGRITAEDVRAHLAKPASSSSSKLQGKLTPHSTMRRMIADHMVQSLLHTAPHVTTVFDCDLGAVLDHRKALKDSFEAKGVHLTLTSYFVRASVAALKAVPEVNSRFHKDGLEIFDVYNIGIAAALEKDGLIVPVIKDAEKLDLFETAKTLQDLTTRARQGKLEGSEVQSGTFTITNHGVSGSLIATPIINQPQSAILGIGKLERRPVVLGRPGNETIEARSKIYVTLTIDHRALDGFAANAFLSAFVGALENWE